MKSLLRLVIAALAAVPCGGAAAGSASTLGSADFKASPDRPVGWRGDWTGKYPGATPPTSWSRRVHGITTAIRYQAAKPSGEQPAKTSRELEYFIIKDWLVTGPIS